jgi:hypothetical protein
MTDAIYQTNNDRRENLKEILKISYDRYSQIKSINNQILAIVATVFLGVLALVINVFASLNTENIYLLIVGIHILIIILLIWRYYSHLIDNELVSCYKRILFCEEKLDIPFEASLASWLEKVIEFELPSKKDSVELVRKKKYFEQSDTNKNLIIQKLIDINRSGYRFHNIWDKTSAYIISFLLIGQLWFFDIHFNQFKDIFIPMSIYIPIGYDFALYGLTKDFKNNITIQRDPSNEELEKIIEDVTKGSNH